MRNWGGGGVGMVARLKLKGIDRRAVPFVDSRKRYQSYLCPDAAVILAAAVLSIKG